MTRFLIPAGVWLALFISASLGVLIRRGLFWWFTAILETSADAADALTGLVMLAAGGVTLGCAVWFTVTLDLDRPST